ncbi:MAG: Fic family protein [Pleurocapsa minor GSE-CHR-MK-17-07R]|jgi:death-on-curing protein|nr:Fic family protein [Pleurocapsa minor GSE-CHR-MK 17-07R]
MTFNLDDATPISAFDLMDINEQVTGESLVRDIHLLNSAVRRPYITLFGQHQFPTVTDKAGALLHSLAYHHLFADGNKRTAVRGVQLFLSRNGLRWDYDPARDDAFILAIAQGQVDVEDVGKWMKGRVLSAE